MKVYWIFLAAIMGCLALASPVNALNAAPSDSHASTAFMKAEGETAPAEGETAVEGELPKEGEASSEGEIEGEIPAEGEVEGEIEGEIEGEGGIQEVALVFPAGNVFVPVDTEEVTLTLAARVSGEGALFQVETSKVYFKFADAYVPASGRSGDLFYLDHTVVLEADPDANRFDIQVTAFNADGEQLVESLPHTIHIDFADDLDGNGLADDPFVALPDPGDCWISVPNDEELGNRVFMVAMEAAKDSTPILFTSGEKGEQVTVLEAPGGLVEPVERGILILAAAPDLASLYTPYDVEEMADQQPGSLAKNGLYVDAKMILSLDDGASFFDLPASRLVDDPVSLIFTDLDLPAGTRLKILGYPSLVDSDPVFGISLVPESGDWSADGIQIASQDASTGNVALSLTALPVVAPFSVDHPGELVVTPASPEGYDFGEVPVNHPATATFTLSNTGGAALECLITLTDPADVFHLQGNSPITLQPGGTKQVKVQFNPGVVKGYEAALFLEPSSGNAQTIPILGTGAVGEKELGFLGCGGNPSHSAFRFSLCDLALLLTLLSGIAVPRVWRQLHGKS